MIMPPYEVELAPRAQNDLRALPAQLLKRVLARLDGLREQPRGRNSVKLKGATPTSIAPGLATTELSMRLTMSGASLAWPRFVTDAIAIDRNGCA